MPNNIYAIFYNENFVDLTLYQYGWEACEPLHSYGPVKRNHFLFHYIISGKGTLLSTDESNTTHEYHLEAGQGFLICPKQHNTYFSDENEPWEYTWLEFDGMKAKEFLTLSGLSFNSPIYNSQLIDRRDIMKEEMLYIVHNSTKSPLELIGHLYLFMDALVTSSSIKKKSPTGKLKDFYVREAISFIEQNYQENISIEEIAAFCNLNRSYLGKLFKDAISVSPQEFLIQYRMNKACELLKITDKSIGEISASVGYPNQLLFSRTFKNQFGQSPRAWRLENKYR